MKILDPAIKMKKDSVKPVSLFTNTLQAAKEAHIKWMSA